MEGHWAESGKASEGMHFLNVELMLETRCPAFESRNPN